MNANRKKAIDSRFFEQFNEYPLNVTFKSRDKRETVYFVQGLENKINLGVNNITGEVYAHSY